MLSKSLHLLATAALAIAAPIKIDAPISVDVGLSCAASRPVPSLPVSGGGKELPAPPAGTTLKYITLGFGIQNYTCSSPSSRPTAAGAIAMLYDITPLYPGQSNQSLPIEAFNQLTTRALNELPLPLNMAPTGGANSTHPWGDDEELELSGMEELEFLGHHWFNADKVPQFKFENGQVDFFAKRLDGVPAPASADAGPDRTGAVDWLQLGDAGGSVGATFVYRVITAGGNSHGCASGKAVDSTSYTTQYWFYG